MEIPAWRETVGVEARPRGDQRVYDYHDSSLTSMNTSITSMSDRYEPIRPIQAPPSPPIAQSSRPSLPSISTLLGYTPGKRRSLEGLNESPTKRQMTIFPRTVHPEPSDSWRASSETIDSRPGVKLPPTPPLRPRSVDERDYIQTPAAPLDLAARPQHLRATSVDVTQRNPLPNTPYIYQSSSRRSPESAPAIPHYSLPPETPSYHRHRASDPLLSPVARGTQHSHRSSAPASTSSYSPIDLQAAATATTSSASIVSHSSPWHHHHYIASSASTNSFSAGVAGGTSSAAERYVCPTCTKAFSRPSSLRIHSHSHTGEKPFKCPHTGCGKAFSVRSNMKRHERGCHAAVPLAVAGMGIGVSVGGTGGAGAVSVGGRERALQPALV